MNLEHTTHYDVAIVGSGIAGSSLAAILAKHGLSVVVLEAGSHPKFAIGESMILETSETMRVLAEFYGVPELAYFSSENYLSKIGTSHGVKRHFSYLHHAPGETPDASRALQAVIPKEPHGHELHLYRQDVDAFLTVCAVKYGATVLQNTLVTGLEVEDDGVTLTTKAGRIEADYLVDAGGFRSLVAEKFGLRDFDLQTHSRALFTHLVGVPDFHAVAGSKTDYGLPFSVHEGTLHHIFEGGWLWVIPFDNHARSTNPLCSVGLLLDPRVHPEKSDLTPEEEFFEFIAQFPAIAKQFENAKAVRAWTRTGRLQYSSHRVVGDRWALLGHAAGFVDPLYSKGLYTTYASVSVLADLLLEAAETGDYSAAHFQPLESLTLAYVKANDRLVANSYKAFAHPKLWNVYSVMWLLGAYTEYVKLTSMRARARDRDGYYAEAHSLRLVGGGFPEFKVVADKVDELLEAVDPHDEAAVDATVAEIKTICAEVAWMPKAFSDLLDGKNHLPRRKLRLDLLNSSRGFLGAGAYREHFFGNISTPAMLKAFVAEKLRYSARGLSLRARLQRPVNLKQG